MATSPAITEDLTNRSLRPLSDAELRVGEYLLVDAWNIIASAQRTVATRLDQVSDTDPFYALVVQIQVAMVLRVLSNPDGVLEESGDDYTRRLDAARSSGSLYLSDAELSMLSENSGTTAGAFTIRPGGIHYRHPWAEI